MKNGKLFVISGASGVGKGTVLKAVMEKRSDLYFSVSATTRDPRPDEVDGVHYYFITREQFEGMIARGEEEGRVVCDYISGMTDQYAMTTYRDIFIPRSWSKF